jgi:hypothetical protein
LLVALFGVLVCLEYGRRGYMPLDHSITFDGGWRVLSGQVPYRDFTTPSGLVPILIQAAFFRVLGVTWFAYCLHAALCNGAFALLTFGILRLAGGTRVVSASFAFFAALLFYPGVGVPSHDHASFAFGLLAAYLLLHADRSKDVRAATAWAGAAGAAVVLGVFSKQVPSLFLLPVLLLVSRRRVAFAAGGFAAVLLFLAAGEAFGVDWSVAREAWIDLPRTQGAARLSEARWSAILLDAPRAYPTLALSVLGFLVAAALAFGPKTPRKLGASLRAQMPIHFLGAGLIVSSVLYIAVTNNQQAYGLGYLPVSLGLTAIAWRTAVGDATVVARRLALAITAAALLVGASEARRFHTDWTETRRLNDFRERPITEDGARIASEMAFLEFAQPEDTADPTYGVVRAEHLGSVVTFFDERPGNFFLLGDSSILYALAGRPSLNPALWFHFGLTIPEPGTDAWDRYEDRILDAMRRNDCRYVVVEHKGTWMGTHLVHFPRLNRLLSEPGGAVYRFGPFYIVPLPTRWTSIISSGEPARITRP